MGILEEIKKTKKLADIMAKLLHFMNTIYETAKNDGTDELFEYNLKKIVKEKLYDKESFEKAAKEVEEEFVATKKLLKEIAEELE